MNKTHTTARDAADYKHQQPHCSNMWLNGNMQQRRNEKNSWQICTPNTKPNTTELTSFKQAKTLTNKRKKQDLSMRLQQVENFKLSLLQQICMRKFKRNANWTQATGLPNISPIFNIKLLDLKHKIQEEKACKTGNKISAILGFLIKHRKISVIHFVRSQII